jgi:MOSC domain-containing protein YiiM
MAQNGIVAGIFICEKPGDPMREIDEVLALTGRGLQGDRYCTGEGSWNKKTGIGNRQVTIMNSRFLKGANFAAADTRRNIFTRETEVPWLIGREFQIGDSVMRGVKYCDPCERPSKLSGVPDFKETFVDCGCIIAEVLQDGIIKRGSIIIPPPKGY